MTIMLPLFLLSCCSVLKQNYLRQLFVNYGWLSSKMGNVGSKRMIVLLEFKDAPWEHMEIYNSCNLWFSDVLASLWEVWRFSGLKFIQLCSRNNCSLTNQFSHGFWVFLINLIMTLWIHTHFTSWTRYD